MHNNKILACLAILLLAIIPTTQKPIPVLAQQTPAGFNVGIAGDTENGSELLKTISSMKSRGVDLVLVPGDFSYGSCSSVDSWWFKMNAIPVQKYGALGNHDNDTACGDQYLADQYLAKFKSSSGSGVPQDSWVYSRDVNSIHIVALNTEDDSGASSSQQNFVKADLEAASKNPNVKWIIVMFHKQMHSSTASINHQPIPALNNAYNRLFVDTGVDLVIQAHMHNYERMKVKDFNTAGCNDPASYPESCNYTAFVVGTGGAGLYPFETISPDSQVRYEGHGYLDLAFAHDGDMLTGRFFANDGSTKDSFTITRQSSNPHPASDPTPAP